LFQTVSFAGAALDAGAVAELSGDVAALDSGAAALDSGIAALDSRVVALDSVVVELLELSSPHALIAMTAAEMNIPKKRCLNILTPGSFSRR